MSSEINVTNIDSNYPVAGVDNSSQGFRDNFANIKLALATAADEITTLQVSTAKANTSTDFNFNTIQKAKFLQSGFTAVDPAAINGNISFSVGHYHKSAITTSTTFVVTNWPSSGVYASVRLEVKPTTSTTFTFAAGPGGTLLKEDSVSLPYSASTTSTVWDLWTTDGGARVFLKFVGGPFNEV